MTELSDDHFKEKICSACGSNIRVFRFKGSKEFYCRKHYDQLYQYGKILEFTIKDTNEIIEEDTYYKITLRNREREVVGFTIINKEDIEIAKQATWSLNNAGYAGNGYVLLHRLIMNPEEGKLVDHINGNKLDNRRSNLRIADKSKNAMNSKISIDNTSGVKGVSLDKRRCTWHSYINIDGKRINLGYFKDFEMAVKVRNEAEIKYFGEYRRVDK